MSKKDKKDCEKDGNCKKSSKICYVGGQALMEGIMMRSKNGYSQVVRNSKGQMMMSRVPIEPAATKNRILNWPIIRGSFRLIDSLTIGMKTLSSSAEIALDELETEEEKQKREEKERKKAERKKSKGKEDKKDKKKDGGFGWALVLSLILSLAISVTLFMLLPNFIAGLVIPKTAPRIFYNLVEAAVRIAIFLLYMFAISRMKDIRRVFMCHGAEHKTIHCFEHDDELTVENVRKYSKHHPRCGTAFMFVIVIVSILIYSVLPRFDFILWNILLRIALLPLIAGIAYEFNRFAGRSESGIAKVLRAPGMAMQRFTTFEPDDSMIECAILALKEALKLDDVPNFSFAQKMKMDPTPVDKEGNILKNEPASEAADENIRESVTEAAVETALTSEDFRDDISADGCEDRRE